ncbi:MAG: hypothetical protein WAW41_10900, partial [Methylobacter sp.]
YNESSGLNERKLTLEDADGRPRFFYYPDVLLSLFELPTQAALEVAAINSLIERITLEQAEAVEKRVQLELTAEKYRTATVRDELKRKLLEQLNTVRQSRNNNERDAIYQLMDVCCGEAMQRITVLQ